MWQTAALDSTRPPAALADMAQTPSTEADQD
jgi:hypothetical protein